MSIQLQPDSLHSTSRLGSVSVEQIIAAVSASEDIVGELEDAILEVLDKHAGEDFATLQELLGIGFTQEAISVLKVCNELIQLYNSLPPIT